MMALNTIHIRQAKLAATFAALAALARTKRWLLQSIEAHAKNPNSVYGSAQALFGIIQGGSFRDLREECAEFFGKVGRAGVEADRHLAVLAGASPATAA